LPEWVQDRFIELGNTQYNDMMWELTPDPNNIYQNHYHKPSGRMANIIVTTDSAYEDTPVVILTVEWRGPISGIQGMLRYSQNLGPGPITAPDGTILEVGDGLFRHYFRDPVWEIPSSSPSFEQAISDSINQFGPFSIDVLTIDHSNGVHSAGLSIMTFLHNLDSALFDLRPVDGWPSPNEDGGSGENTDEDDADDETEDPYLPDTEQEVPDSNIPENNSSSSSSSSNGASGGNGAGNGIKDGTYDPYLNNDLYGGEIFFGGFESGSATGVSWVWVPTLDNGSGTPNPPPPTKLAGVTAVAKCYAINKNRRVQRRDT